MLRRSNGVFKADVDDALKPFDLGLAFGGGVSYPVGRFSVFAQGHYTLGLSNIAKAGPIPITIRDERNIAVDDEVNPADTKTRGLQVMAGVTFRVGR